MESLVLGSGFCGIVFWLLSFGLVGVAGLFGVFGLTLVAVLLLCMFERPFAPFLVIVEERFNGRVGVRRWQEAKRITA